MDGYDYDGEHPWHDDRDGDDDASRRKRPRNRRIYRRQPPPAAVPLDLTVRGTMCPSHRDDILAQSLDGESHLINYFEDRLAVLSDGEDMDEDSGCCIVDDDGEAEVGGRNNGAAAATPTAAWRKGPSNAGTTVPTLFMDRFDARMLLDDYGSFRRRRRSDRWEGGGDSALGLSMAHAHAIDEEDGLSKDQIDDLNFERFGALPEYRTLYLGEYEPEGSKSEAPSGPDAARSAASAARAAEEKAPEEPFVPTEEEAMCLPDGMVMPSTRRQNDVVQLTAQRSSAAPQFEVLLRLKQSSNADFAFLHPGHSLHPYYSWLKGRKGEIVGATADAEKAEQKKGIVDYASSSSCPSDGNGGGGAMSGLLAMYSSSSDDEAETTEGTTLAIARKNDVDLNKLANPCAPKQGKTNQDEASGFAAESKDGSASASDHVEPELQSQQIESLEERRAKRLKKARMMKGHFASKIAQRKS